MVTFGSILDDHKGVGPGFDAIRVLLSISILCFHSNAITGNAGWNGGMMVVASILVPVFFAVSGFLVIASAIRVPSLATFLTYRGLRIAPALFAEVMITALIIGPIVTTLPIAEYFAHSEFWRYWLNLVGNIHYTLPGVFQDNAMKQVNATLWTVPPEIVCYLLLALIMLAGLHTKRTFFIWLVGFAVMGGVVLSLALSDGPWGTTFYNQAKYVVFFLVGNLVYHYRHSIPYSPWLCGACAVVGIALLQFPGWEILSGFPIVYCVAYAGLSPIPLPSPFNKGDYSYGIYLFAWPIQQIVASVPWTRVWWLNIMIALPITICVAAASWHWIEKPFLNLKKTMRVSSDTEKRFLRHVLVRFSIAFALIFYGIAVAAGGGMLSQMGTNFRASLPQILVFCAIASLAVTLIRSRAVASASLVSARS